MKTFNDRLHEVIQFVIKYKISKTLRKATTEELMDCYHQYFPLCNLHNPVATEQPIEGCIEATLAIYCIAKELSRRHLKSSSVDGMLCLDTKLKVDFSKFTSNERPKGGK